MTTTDLQFQAGGTLVPNKHIYVERAEQEELFEKCIAGEYCYILAARQLGKSSMVQQVIERLKRETPTQPISTSLDAIARTRPSDRNDQMPESFADLWYKSFLLHVLDKSELLIDGEKAKSRSYFLSWWKTNIGLDNIQKMTSFFKEIILKHFKTRVIVFIDEIDRFPQELIDDFLMALRYFHNERAEIPEWQQLSFVLIGHRLPRHLTVDKSISPFNIGTRIDLGDLDINRGEVLTRGIIMGGFLTPRKMLERVFVWTNGHPYLTHAACKKIYELTTDETTPFYLSTEEQIDSIIFELTKSEFADIHLNKIIDWIDKLPNQMEVIRLYGYILEGNKIVFDETIQSLDDLRYSGLIKITADGNVSVRNKVYSQKFDKEWVIYELRDRHGALNPLNFSFGLERLGLRVFKEPINEETATRSDAAQTSMLEESETDDVFSFDEVESTEELHSRDRNPNQVNSSTLMGVEELNERPERSKTIIEKFRDNFNFPSIRRSTLIRSVLMIAGIVAGTMIITWLISEWGLHIDSTLAILLSGTFLTIILLIIGISITVSSDRNLVERRLGQYLDGETEDKREDNRSALTDWVNQRVEKSSLGDRVARELARADLKLKVGEYFGLIIITTIASSAIFGFLGNWNIPLVLVGAVIGSLIPHSYIKRQQSRRSSRFEDQLNSALDLIVNGLRAGYSTMQAFEAVSRDLPSPLSDEFRRVVQEMQLGVSMETALDNLLRRVPSRNLDILVTAINIQREVGGNLAEVLDTISSRFRMQYLDKLQAKRLGFPSFTFFFVSSSIVLTFHSIIYPKSLDRLAPSNNLWGAIWLLMLTWSLILIIRGIIRSKRIDLISRITEKKQRENIIIWAIISLTIAYLFGVPNELLVWLLFMLLLWTPFGVLIISGIWLFEFFYFFANIFPAISIVSERLQNVNMFVEKILTLLFGVQSSEINPSLQIPSQPPWLFWMVLLILAFCIAIILVVVGNRANSQDYDEDPLMARLAEFSERGELVSLEQVELSQSFSERFTISLLRRLGEFFVRFTPHKALLDTTRNLGLAGNPFRIDATTFLASRLLFAITLGGLSIFIVSNSSLTDTTLGFLLIIGAIFAGYILPQLVLRNQIIRRQSEIRKSIPDALDLLAICVGAGLSFDSAMSKVSEKWESELSLAFAQAIREVQLGKLRREAFRDMADRIGIPEMDYLVATIIQSESLGVSMGNVLRIQSDSITNDLRESLLASLNKFDTASKILLAILFGPILLFWFAWPMLAQLSSLP